MKRALSIVVVCALAGTAWANGRPPAAINLHVRPGQQDQLVLAATFGALFSSDNGATWRWMCETAIGYGGTYDPDYAVSPTGRVFATTFDGLQVKQDDCVFMPSAFGATFAAQVAVAPNGNVIVARSFPGDETVTPPLPPEHKVFRSTNDGASFNAGVMVTTGQPWWASLDVAPSDPNRVYLTGYKVMTGQPKTLLFYRSDDGGLTFDPMPIGTFEVTDRSDLEIAAISKTDPDRLLMRVTWWMETIGDAFYLSTNGGTSWTKVLEVADLAHAVTFRQNGEAIIGTSQSGTYRSATGAAPYNLLPDPQPDLSCLRERENGELWGCTNNYAAPPFDYGLMKTTDLTNWTGVMRFQDITGPVACAAGTIMQDCCTVHVAACPFQLTPEWCGLRAQLGITANPIECATVDGGLLPDAAGTGGGGGCCGAGAQPVGVGVLTALVALGLGRRRRSWSHGR